MVLTRKNPIDWDGALAAFGSMRHLRGKNITALVRKVRRDHSRKLSRTGGRSPRLR